MRAIACSIMYAASLFYYHFEQTESDRGVPSVLVLVFLVATIVFLFKDKPAP